MSAAEGQPGMAGEMLTIFAVGNESRGDDALGPRLLEQASVLGPAGARLVGDFQLQVELVCDIEDAALVLFIDAGEGTPAPFVFWEETPRAGKGASHALEPAELLEVYARVYRRPPPPAFVLCVAGEDFTLGASLSAAAQGHLGLAQNFLSDLLARPSAALWRARAQPRAA